MQSNPGMPTSRHKSAHHQPSVAEHLVHVNVQDARLSALPWRTCISCNMRRYAPNAGLMRTLYPECRAAVAMVTGHQQPDPRVGRPGRELNPVLVLSQGTADVQSQGATEKRSPGT
jgi:hypothetical protein